GVSCSCVDVGGPPAADGDHRIAGLHAAEQKFESAELVPACYRCVEVIAPHEQFARVCNAGFQYWRSNAPQWCAGQLLEGGEAIEQRRDRVWHGEALIRARGWPGSREFRGASRARVSLPG